MNLPRFAVENKSVVLAALVLALLWSLGAFLTMQRREDPLVPQRRTEIVTLWPGASTENVEQLVTKKVVDDVRGVAHVGHVEGISRPGISDVAVFFDDAMTDADSAVRDVRDRVADLGGRLPAGTIGPHLVDDIWKTYPVILGVSLSGSGPDVLRDVATQLKNGIATLPDVATVGLVGVDERQVDVDIDLRRLTDYGVTASDVVSAIQARNALVPAGTIAFGERLAQVDAAHPLSGTSDVAAATIAAPGGRTVRVGDVADVRIGYADPPDEIVRVDGRPAVALAIQIKDTSSVTSLGPRLRAYLDATESQRPPGTVVSFVADQPHEVRDRVNEFWANLMLAVVLVIVLVGLFMGARNGLIVGATVALSIVLTIGIMPLVGVDINQISLLALIVSLGIVVDAGIVAIDSIENHLRAGSDRRTAAWMGLHVLRLPLLTSTLVAMSSFFPFRFMGGGSTGDFVAALGIVTTAALAISLLVAYFVTPILGEWFAAASDLSSVSPVERAVRRPFEALLAALQRWYVPLATASLRRPGLTVAIAVVLTVLAVAAMPLLGIQFFPSADRNQFVITVNAAEGTDLRTTARFVERIEARLRGRPGLLTYGAFIGASAPRFYYNLFPEQPKPSYAEIIVNTVDVATTNRLVGELGGEFERTLPGVRVEVKPFQQGPPVGTPIQIRLTGSDRAELAWFAERIRGVLAGVPGAAHVRDSLGVPTTRIGARIDEDRAALAGVSDVSIQQLLALAYGGETATDIRGNDRETPVVVRLPEALRGTLDTVDALSVRNDAGAPVPLSEVVTTQLQTQTSVSTMRDGMPTVTVLAEARDRMPSAVLADFRARFAAFPIPPGVSIVYAGENEEIETSFRNLAIALGIGLLINQTILLWEFRQLRVSLVVLSAVPLGLVGAVFGLAVTDSPLGFVGALGIASLGGIVTNHAIVLFEYAKRERAAGLPMERALIVAGSKRLRPIMLTVLAAVAGLLPLAFSGQTLWRPFCWAIAFGLGNSMLMTLIAIPAVYRFVCGRGERTRDVPANGLHAKTREVALTEMPTS